MKVFKHLFSGWLMGVLLIAFASVIGYATFVENDFGPEAARLSVYNSTWFEALLFLMVVNFTGMIFTKHLYLRSKWNVLVIHLALILIIIGAGVTRYFGSEGMMHIRDGKSVNEYRSSNTYLTIKLEKDGKIFEAQEKIILSVEGDKLLSKTYNVDGNEFDLVITKYHVSSKLMVVPSNEGHAFINLVIGGPNGRQDIFLKEGESIAMTDFDIVFGDSSQTDALVVIKNGEDLLIRYPEQIPAAPLNIEDSVFKVGGFNEMKLMSVQKVGDISFVVKDFMQKGNLEYIMSDEPS